MSNLNDLNNLGLDSILGFFLPLLIGWLTSRGMSSQLKGAVAFAVCLAAATVQAFLTGNWNAADYVTSVLAIVTVANASYNTIMKAPAQALQGVGPIKTQGLEDYLARLQGVAHVPQATAADLAKDAANPPELNH